MILKLIGNFLYFIGALMVVVPIIVLLATGGMAILAGYGLLLIPALGIAIAIIGKKILKDSKRVEQNR